MLGLVLNALWRRRAQTALLLLLATVAAGGAATAPGYVLASVRSLAIASISDATRPERVVAVGTERELGASATTDLARFTEAVTRELGAGGFTQVAGADMVAVFGNEISRIAYRDDVCAHISISGACPGRPGEVLVETTFAQRLSIDVGDLLPVRGRTETALVPMTVVGRYRAINPLDPYWGRPGQGSAGERLKDAVLLTPLETFGALRPNRIEFSLDLTATPASLRRSDPDQLADLVDRAASTLSRQDIQVISDLRSLADRLDSEQDLVYQGVAIGVGQLLLTCWLALFLAIRLTARIRRDDIGLLKMRGARRRDTWVLVLTQSLGPLLVGGLIGLLAGPRLANWLAGPVDGQVAARAWYAAAAAALIAIAGAGLAALAAELRSLAEPVANLNQRLTTRRGGRAGRVVDALVVLLAAAAVYQLVTGDSGPGTVTGVRGLDLLAPLLIALALGLLSVRLLPVAAARAGRWAVRTGRLSTGLAAMHLARRPGTSGVLAVVVVVAAMLISTTLAWSVSLAARDQRAVADVGAGRVLTVRATSPAALLAAVRAADPDGRFALAAAISNPAGVPVVAVDSDRLAAVAPWLPGYGLPPWPDLAGLLHPPGYPPVTLRGPATLDTSWNPPTADAAASGSADGRVGEASLVVHVDGPDGRATTIQFGPLRAGRHSYTAPGSTCASGCRLVSVALSAPGGLPAGTVSLTVHGLRGVVGSGVFTDRTRWRTSVLGRSGTPELIAGQDGLTIRLDAAQASKVAVLDLAAYVVDAPAPLPLISTAGPDPDLAAGLDRVAGLDRDAEPRFAVLGREPVPVRIAATASALPQVGAGLLVDLEYAARLDPGNDGATLQVWLSGTAPADIERRLAEQDVQILTGTGIEARRDELAARGPAVALRFLLVTAVVILLLALVTFAVSGVVERRARGAELGSLRDQGLTTTVVRRVAFGGYLALGLLAIGLGSAIGLAVHSLLPAPLPVFADQWHTMATPAAPAAMVTVAGLFMVLGVAAVAVLAGWLLVAATRRAGRGAR
ncbi:MAG TPA: FtsX-like permease family protein [Micromonosporaceae bacterium]